MSRVPDSAMPAFPMPVSCGCADNAGDLHFPGLTKREYFAARVMQGLLANPSVIAPHPACGWSLVNSTEQMLCEYAAELADVALAALEAKP
jgi:hypothetical protein